MRLIDADDLLTAFPIDDEPMLTTSCVRMTIRRMPTIEDRKKGKWILKSTNGEEFYWCSECGRVTFDDPTNYCPICQQCGAEGTKGYCPNCGSYNGGGDDDQN